MATVETTEDLRELIRILPGYDPYAQGEGYVFKPERGQWAIDWIEEYCIHTDDKWAGKPFLLEPWQKAIIGNLYGWYDPKTGLRRYRECLIFVPRKNGKTQLAAALILLGLIVDTSPGARIYSSAADWKQAKICFDAAVAMLRAKPPDDDDGKPTPALAAQCTIYEASVTCEDRSYTALTAESGTKYGFKVDRLVNDELHAQKTRKLTDALMTGMGSRSQPLAVHLTTSDHERPDSICNEKHDYAMAVCANNGAPDRPGFDPQFLPAIYQASIDDDWTDPAVHRKANPNLGVSLQEDYLIRECRRAKTSPVFENTFKQVHLNIRTQQANRVIVMERWDECEGELPADLDTRPCHGGIDLGATSDLTALARAYRLPDGRYAVTCRVWVPSEAVAERTARGDLLYATWVRGGHMVETAGREVDYARVRSDLVKLHKIGPFQELAVDPKFQGRPIIQWVCEEDGLPAFAHTQGFSGMAGPMATFIELVNTGQIVHNGDPVLRWAIGNLTAKANEAGHMMPVKVKAGDKIDPAVSAIMAVGRAVAGTRHAPMPYLHRGILTLDDVLDDESNDS